MKKTLKLLPLLLAVMLTIACKNYGKRVAIEGTKGEIYYKGPGVTESDAKKVGEYLKKIDFFTNDKATTAQILKKDDAFTVRFVYDKNFYDKTPAAENSFKIIGADMSKNIFDGKKVNISLADSLLVDFKTIPFDASASETTASTTNTSGSSSLGSNNSGLSSESGANTLEGYEHEKIGNIVFYWKDIAATDEKVVSDYVVKNGAFVATNEVNIITNKEGDRYIVRFPVGDSYSDSDTNMQNALEKVAQQIKDNVFANQHYSFIVTDTKLNKLKSWDF